MTFRICMTGVKVKTEAEFSDGATSMLDPEEQNAMSNSPFTELETVNQNKYLNQNYAGI